MAVRVARRARIVGRIALCLLWLAPGARPAQSEEFDYRALRSVIERDRLGSIEAVLNALPVDLRSRYVLMFSSRSLQQASFREPRVILYSADGRLIVSFNGHPTQAGYEALEIAEFDADEAKFRFRELRFAGPSDDTPLVAESAADPVRCQRCHGSPVRPIWDMPPLWPGAYGERYRQNLSAAEREGIRDFLRRQAAHPRYRALIGAERFVERTTYHPDAHSEYDGAYREPPNAEFAELLSRLNMQALARQFVIQPRFASAQFALLGAAEGTCGSVSQFLPESDRAEAERSLQGFSAASRLLNARQAEAKRARALARSGGTDLPTGESSSAASLMDVRFLAEALLGQSAREWTLELEKGTYDFGSLREGSTNLANALRAAVAKSDARVGELHALREGSTDDRYCVYLRERSRVALSHGPHIGTVEQHAGPPPLPAELALQHCASCHALGVGPPLPFDQPELLGSLLRIRGYIHGDLLGEILFRLSPEAHNQRMPPDVVWDQPQSAALSRYLVTLGERR
jgi:hypothetical protein